MRTTPFASDSEYYLYRLADIFDNGNQMYSIYDSNNEYCGIIELKNPVSDTPEIGIELLEDKRNQGIAAKVVKLIIQKTSKVCDVKYFLIRISSRNPHSKYVFEKMGAIYIGEDNNVYKTNCGDNKSELIYKYKLLPSSFEY